MNGDKYSGLVTTLAVLMVVIYTGDSETDKYDYWDLFLGTIGFILGIKYIQDAKNNTIFFLFLIASLLSLSSVIILFYYFEHYSYLKEFLEFLYESSFRTFIFLILIYMNLILALCNTKNFNKAEERNE